MKTMQEYFKEADADRVVKEYIKRYPIKYEESEDRMKLSVREIHKNEESRLVEYIHRMQLMEIPPNEDNILFAHKCLYGDMYYIAYTVVHKQELLAKGAEANIYLYDSYRLAEIMGFLISDADFTQKSIYDMMVDILHEYSLCEYEDEYLKNLRKMIDDAIIDVKTGELILTTTTTEKLFNVENEATDEVEEQLYRKYEDYSVDYTIYCQKREMEILRQLLEQEKEITCCLSKGI